MHNGNFSDYIIDLATNYGLGTWDWIALIISIVSLSVALFSFFIARSTLFSQKRTEKNTQPLMNEDVQLFLVGQKLLSLLDSYVFFFALHYLLDKIDVEKEEDIREKYKVNCLPKLILVDMNGKEIHRWKGITEPSEINEYLFDNGFADSPKTQEIKNNSNTEQDVFKQTDMKLASQFVVESMSDLEYAPYSGFSDDFATSELQKQFAHYCLMVKSNLAMDAVGQSHPFMLALKQHIRNYIADSSNKDNQAMKYLYELEDMNLLIQQVSMLTLHANMKRIQNISNITHEEFHLAMNPEQVALSMGFYTYFTILVNDNINEDDFNELFVESWINYYANIQARLFMFRMRGNTWKNDFKGVLLDD